MDSILDRKLVLVAIQDEGTTYTAAAVPALKRIGAHDPIFQDYRHSYALVGYAGSVRPSWVRQEQQKRTEGPSIISMRVPLMQDPPSGKMSRNASYNKRVYECGTKARLSFSGGPLAPVNMADSMEEVSVDGEKCKNWLVCYAVQLYISYAKFSQILEVLQDFHRGKKQSNY